MNARKSLAESKIKSMKSSNSIPILFAAALVAMIVAEEDAGPIVPAAPIVVFLQRVQQTAFRSLGGGDADPKLYVDLSLKQTLASTSAAFEKLPRNSSGCVAADDLKAFIGEYFGGAEDGLVPVDPVDFAEEPEDFLPLVKDRKIREWALQVHRIWRDLTRKVSGRVVENPEQYTLLPLDKPVVVPGSRFREVYYWDSYWIIRGLLASKMYDTASGMVHNFISQIHKYGYVLNGARAYYTNRSQPPLLSSMVVDIFRRTADMELIAKSLPALIKEHHFWTCGFHQVLIAVQGSVHRLSRYYAMWNDPRPESSTIDRETAAKLPNNGARRRLYRDIASAAESGWDFSSRWMRNASDLATLATTSIVPVDLNAFILKMEMDIAFLANATGDEDTSERFKEYGEARRKAIDAVMWNGEMGQWLDYWLKIEEAEVHKWIPSGQNHNIYASNFVPLWLHPLYSDGGRVDAVVGALEKSGLIREAGIATSVKDSGQQWDFPNGWAPLQHMICEGMARSSSGSAKAVAESTMAKWITTNYASFQKIGAMHEKYDVERCGSNGGGGEYAPQTGFGWSNGVVLALLEEFGWSRGTPRCAHLQDDTSIN